MLPTAVMAATMFVSQPTSTFGDWTAGCDNGRVCQASAYASEEEEGGATLTLKRGPMRGDRPEIWLVSTNKEAMIAEVRVDGRPLRQRLTHDERGLFFVAEDSLGFLRSLHKGRKARLVDDKGRDLGPLLITGATAALLLIDERQSRLNTRGALVRRGVRPDTAVLRPPRLPIVRTPRRSARAPAPLDRALVDRLFRKHGCEEGNVPREQLAERARLDARHSVLKVTFLCKSGAYNVVSELLVVPDGGSPTPARFDVLPMTQDESDNRLIYNVDWVPDERRLWTGFKGRGYGDCGTAKSYAWDGSGFRLVEAMELTDCRSVTDFTTTFRARVVER